LTVDLHDFYVLHSYSSHNHHGWLVPNDRQVETPVETPFPVSVPPPAPTTMSMRNLLHLQQRVYARELAYVRELARQRARIAELEARASGDGGMTSLFFDMMNKNTFICL
jgi:hypothetical protein